ncbi:MAG: YraN family protein [Bacteroidales bacterium]|nr:YraN family protein [Bacteroidales bacterium]
MLEKSWHFKHKEVDIIAEMQNELIFVEVKTRKSNFWGNPENFVTKQKQRFLIEAANQYINKIQHLGDVRFDIIAILYENSQTTIEHIENAFYP